MKITNVLIKNYLSYGDTDVSLDIDDTGIIVVSGANGLGKSTIFSAIIWALYGKTPMSVDSVVNRYTKKNCKVSVTFEMFNKQYTVFRYRKHSTHGNNVYIFQGDKDISLRGINETQQLIQDTIQIPYQALVSSLIFSTENYRSFLRAKPSDRLAIIESVLSLKEISTYYSVLKDLIKNVEEEQRNQNGEKDKIETAVHTLTETAESYKQKVKKDLENIKKEKSNQEKIKEDLLLKFSSSINIEEETQKIKTYESVLQYNNEIENQISQINNEDIESIERSFTFVVDELEELLNVDVNKEKEEIKKTEEVIRKNNEIKNEIKVLTASIKSVSSFKDTISSLTIEKEKHNKDLESIGKSVCPLCGQTTDAKMNASIVSDKKKKIDEIDIRINEVLKNLAETEKTNDSINNKIRELKSQIEVEKDNKYSIEELDTISLKIAGKQKEKDYYFNKIENNKKILSIINNLRDKIKPLPEVPSYTLKELEEYDHINDKIKTIDDEIALLLKQAKSLYDKEYVNSIEEKKVKLLKGLSKIEKKLSEVDNDKLHYQFLIDLFSNKEGGFKRFFIEKIIHAFNDNINKYLPFFFDKEISITFDKELVEKIQYDGYDVEFASFSSGQKTRIDLAIAFSLFFLVKVFFSSNVNLMVFDEILDQNLDAEGIRAVMSIVENLSKSTAIYIISHREEYKDKAEKRINVFTRDGFTYLDK